MNANLLILPLRATAGAARLSLRLGSQATALVGRLLGVSRPQPGPASEWARRPSSPASPSGPASPSSPISQSSPASLSSPISQSSPASPSSPTSRPARPPSGNGPPAATTTPPPAATAPPPAVAPSPLTRGEAVAKAVDDTPELVGESADRGAEEGAGAQVEVEPPWPGYEAMTAGAVIDRIAAVSPAELAVVGLYERSHKHRRTVLAAVERRARAAG
jgi:hypothetical protein